MHKKDQKPKLKEFTHKIKQKS